MNNKTKRILSSITGIHLNENPPNMQSLVPLRISNLIMAGKLPRFSPKTIMLEKNESCHFMDNAALVIKKHEKTYLTRRTGDSYRLTKNLIVHSNNGTTKPVEQTWYEYKEGILYITNERVIFVEPENGFEMSLHDVTAVVPYSDAISLQFASKTVNLIVPESRLLAMVIRMLY